MKKILVLSCLFFLVLFALPAKDYPLIYITDINSYQANFAIENGELSSVIGSISASLLLGARPNNSDTILYTGLGIDEVILDSLGLISIHLKLGATQYFSPYPLMLGIESSLLSTDYYFMENASQTQFRTIADNLNTTLFIGTYADALIPNMMGTKTKNRLGLAFTLGYSHYDDTSNWTIGMKARIEMRGYEV